MRPDQKWYNYEDNVELMIEKINYDNATIAGTYGIVHDGEIEKFEFRGSFDPDGSTLGWSLSYWNKYENYHANGVWTGYLETTVGGYKMSTSGTIAHQSDHSTTHGEATFVLQD